jgi:branched-subunit amino acid aminotransferase/4-amino-4-deoxychorismate lyase
MSDAEPAPLVPAAMVEGVRTALADARLPVTDPAVVRGDGVFETVGVWAGRPFALADHLERLAGSLAAAHLPAVDTGLLAGEVEALLDGTTADAHLRIIVSASGRRLLLLDHPPRRPPLRRVILVPAPWIAPDSPIAGVKSLSYQPNMVALRAAQEAGADDALLHTADGIVLEGTTFGVCWVVDGRIEAPTLALGILDSISRRTLVALAGEQGMEITEGRFAVGRLLAADEVLAVSSLRPLAALERVGDRAVGGPVSPVRDLLGPALEAARRGTAVRRPEVAGSGRDQQ